MKRRYVIGAVALAILFAGRDVAHAGTVGSPGSEARRAWCESKLTACRKTARQPGFLGGPRNYCNNETDKPDCIGVCELAWGKASSCMTDLHPRSDCSSPDCAHAR
jgi:hypothetical protein